MHELDSDQLSPRRLPQPVECDLPYGLTWEDLRPCLADLDESRAGECRAFVAFEKGGRAHLQGSQNSCILTLRHPALREGSRETTVFVKDLTKGRPAESGSYAFLGEAGIATPRLFAAVAAAAGEIIVTEFLPRIGIDVTSLVEVTQLLALLAQLNSTMTPPDTFKAGPGTPREVMDARRKAGLARLALDSRTRVDVDRWFEGFVASREAVLGMPQALTHGEFSFQQCGWAKRGDNSTLVIFDLATLSRRPRLGDLVSILPSCAAGTDRAEIELLDIYLGSLREVTGSAPPTIEAMRELLLVRAEGTFSALHWLTHDVWEPGSDELLQVARQLRADMVATGLLHAE